MVSKINLNSRTVTVEWYERGETKGKEVELDAILQLNTELLQEQSSAPVPKKQATAASNLSRVNINFYTYIYLFLLYYKKVCLILFNFIINCSFFFLFKLFLVTIIIGTLMQKLNQIVCNKNLCLKS